MKTIIFSDTHLTNNFDQKKFDWLNKVISEADQVIINGDFWDGYFISFDEFINSEWSKLFPLLRSKKAIYHYGNHDTEEMLDDRVNLFAQEVRVFSKIISGKNRFHIEHGNRISPELSARFPWLKRNMWALRFLTRVESPIQWVLLRIFGNLPLRGPNEEMKSKRLEFCDGNEILVCGHSHRHEFNLSENFINTGENAYGNGKYLLIDDNKIELI